MSLQTHGHVNTDNDASNKRVKLEPSDEEEDCFDCVICSESWESKGDHRLVSLKCGHLFGKKCIERWIHNKTKKQGSKKAGCPMCMKTTVDSNIRIVKPCKIAVKDTSQSELLKKELENLKMQIKTAEKDIDMSFLALNLHKKELERAKERKLNGLNSYIKLNKAIPVNQTTHSESTHKNMLNELDLNEIDTPPSISRYTILSSTKLSDQRHIARVMSLVPNLNIGYISFKSSDTVHSIIKLDLSTSTQIGSIDVHQGLIREIQCSKHNQDIIASTSMDKSLKIISSKTNKVESIMNLPLPGWSCSFDEIDDTKVYCGLGNSTILMYDIRYTSNILEKFENPTLQKSPLHSMFAKYVNHNLGIICSNLNQSFVWNVNANQRDCILFDVDTTNYKPYSLSWVDGSENSILLSLRNSQSTRHRIMKLDKKFNVHTVSNYEYSSVQKSLTRTLAYLVNNDRMLSFGDESNGMLRLVKSENEFQHFKIHNCPLDIKPYTDHKLAFLTDNRFFLTAPNFF